MRPGLLRTEQTSLPMLASRRDRLRRAVRRRSSEGLIGIGRNGRLGLPGGEPTWEPAGYATLERVLALTR